MGPGPSDVDPRVLRAMSTPVIGHLDPDFLAVMNDTVGMLRQVFRTQNELTLAISGTGSAGMEASLMNVLEPGDRVVVCIIGFFGQRMLEIVERCGAKPVVVEAEWGKVVEPDAVRKALAGGRTKLVALVHAETSTGILQPLEEIVSIAHEHDAMVAVDAVTSLGGVAVDVDARGLDVCYSGSQKCLGCPPGLAPVTFGPRALEALDRRSSKVHSWYLDVTVLRRYWGSERFYHHTAPISLVYALRESLRLALEEGEAARFERHRRLGGALASGLEAMGLSLFADARYRSSMLTSVRIPEGIDDLQVRRKLLSDYGLEIGGGLGKLKGSIWRIGLMGHSCRLKNLSLCLVGLGSALQSMGWKADISGALSAVDHAL
ncbi:MAG: alanine--glyoxylate aminotransferase family protein [Firmicutes bacterium]|nr:alanine--glyoxylate aminotransferase family protein [Bacillota bacterium]